MPKQFTESFDFLFIGMGAANCLVLLKLHEKGLLGQKSIAIIDPNTTSINDRNYCFWSSEEELHKLNLAHLVSSMWDKIEVAGRNSQNIAPLRYHHVRGFDLNKEVQAILGTQKTKFYSEAFGGKPTVNSDSYELTLNNAQITANYVFDSRPPVFAKAKKNQCYLHQSFYGWEIKVTDHRFDTSAMVMMDFEIPQNDFCQFMYILPFSENTALFEVTRFGTEKITSAEAYEILKQYLTKFNFSYQILDEEQGVIPMSSLKIDSVNYGDRWITTGSNANLVKPTTGYAFHNMAKDAACFAEAMVQQQPFARKKTHPRFHFYDGLLLKILEETPHHGKRIFHDLFNRIPLKDVLTFLSEKTPFTKELFIFSKLPIGLFVRAAIKDLFYRFTATPPVAIALIFTLFSLVLHAFNLDFLVYLFLGLGFLSIGLSHGALDHLTNNAIEGSKQIFKYVVEYLFKGACLGVIWFIWPNIALLIFIAFSAWHFGQADFKEWKLKQGLMSFTWGLLLLSIILLSHLTETLAVLQQIKGLKLYQSVELLSATQIQIGMLALTIFSLLLCAIQRSKQMLLSLSYLLLASMLPLLVSFGTYFVIQHSLQGWTHLKFALNTNSYQLWLKSVYFSAGGALIFLLFMLANSVDYVGIFFILLSCISIPHVLSMHHFYERFSIHKGN